MKLDFEVWSNASWFALFDPAAVPELIRSTLGIRGFIEQLRNETQRGNLLLYEADYDGDALIRVYVDEDAEQRLCEVSRRSLQGALLRVPSGRLLGVGADAIRPRSKDHQTPEAYVIDERPGATEHAIPAGNYAVEGYDVDPLDPRIETSVRQEAGEKAWKLKEYYDSRIGLGCALVSLAGIVSAGGLLAAYWWGGTGWTTAIGIIGGCIAVVAIYGVATWKELDQPRYRDAQDKVAAARKEWPGILVVLRSITEAEAAGEFTPAIMRPVYVNESAAGKPGKA